MNEQNRRVSTTMLVIIVIKETSGLLFQTLLLLIHLRVLVILQERELTIQFTVIPSACYQRLWKKFCMKDNHNEDLPF